MVGMVCTAVFAHDVGLTSGHLHTFVVQLAALAIATVFSAAGAFVLYKVTDLLIPMRVAVDHEDLGLDLSQHGETILTTLPLDSLA